MRVRAAMMVLVLVVVVGEAWGVQQQPMDLLQALQQGRVEAVFYGNGDQSVRGRIRGSPFGPNQLYVPPGTQFWAQQPGFQGMTTLGYVPIDLQTRPIAYVQIPTACTNLNLPAPTPYHIMVPTPCPDARMAALCHTIGRTRVDRASVQLAVWAVANDPAWEDVAGYAESHVRGEDEEAVAEAVAGLRETAAALLTAAGLEPTRFVMFQ
jgi:hypothetical protein